MFMTTDLSLKMPFVPLVYTYYRVCKGKRLLVFLFLEEHLFLELHAQFGSNLTLKNASGRAVAVGLNY